MKSSINLNDAVTVTLTKAGANTYNQYMLQFANCPWPTKQFKVEGDIVRTQLWDLISIFGSSVHLGMQAPFEMCEINLEEK